VNNRRTRRDSLKRRFIVTLDEADYTALEALSRRRSARLSMNYVVLGSRRLGQGTISARSSLRAGHGPGRPSGARFPPRDFPEDLTPPHNSRLVRNILGPR